MTTATMADIGRIRSQLTTLERQTELAFERAFDLQQAGASEDRVDAAIAELGRLQQSAGRLREQLGERATLH